MQIEVSERCRQLQNKWKLLIPSTNSRTNDFTKPVGFYYDGNVRIAEPGNVAQNLLVALHSIQRKS